MKTRTNRRFRLSPALVVSSVALFAALSGAAVALPGQNTVNSGDIINGQVKTQDIKGEAVKNGKLADNIKSRWAIVHHNGSLVSGRTASEADKVGVADNLYAVTFNRDVSECAYIATLTEITGGDNLGFVSTQVSGSDPNQVIVETRDHNGSGDPRSFHLQVSC